MGKLYENQLIISAVDGNGQIIASQPYAEFIYGKKNLEILNYYTGQKLFDILHDDLGKIRFEDNKFVLKSILFDVTITNNDEFTWKKLQKRL